MQRERGAAVKLLAIDPGPVQSAYVYMDAAYNPVDFGKVANKDLIEFICQGQRFQYVDACVIEMIASYGMPVGAEVFETCVYIGRLIECLAYVENITAERLYRKDVKLHLCHSSRAKDGNVVQALKDRFGDKGTKNAPGFFHGFKADCWQAFACGVTFKDLNEITPF